MTQLFHYLESKFFLLVNSFRHTAKMYSILWNLHLKVSNLFFYGTTCMRVIVFVLASLVVGESFSIIRARKYLIRKSWSTLGSETFVNRFKMNFSRSLTFANGQITYLFLFCLFGENYFIVINFRGDYFSRFSLRQWWPWLKNTPKNQRYKNVFWHVIQFLL